MKWQLGWTGIGYSCDHVMTVAPTNAGSFCLEAAFAYFDKEVQTLPD